MKIGVIQARPGIGDLCVFLPFVHVISKFFKTKVILITKKRTWAKDILKADPYINEVFYLDENQRSSNLSLINFLKKKKLEKIFIFHFGLRYWAISKISGLKEIYFYGFQKKNVSITEYVKKKIKEWLKKKSIKYDCKIYYLKKNKNKNKINKIVIGIGGSGENKKWKIENYIKLIEMLSKKKKYNFLIAGGKNEAHDFKKIKKKLPRYNLTNLCHLSIEKCLYLLEGSKFYIGNDTGFMHLCGSLGIKSFGIFGDTPSDYCNYNDKIISILPKGYKETKQGDRALNKIFAKDVLNNSHFKKCHL